MESDYTAYEEFLWRTDRPDNDSRLSPFFTIGDTRCLAEVYHCSSTYGMAFHAYDKPPSTFRVNTLVEGENTWWIFDTVHVGSRGCYPTSRDTPRSQCDEAFKHRELCIKFYISGKGNIKVQPVDEQNVLKYTPDYSFSLNQLADDFRHLLDFGSDHDVKLRCEGQVLPAHRNILSARSKVLTDMLQSNRPASETGLIDIQGMSFPVLELFLEYVYSGTLSDVTADQAKELHEAGDKYEVGGLKEWCTKFLEDHLEDSNGGNVSCKADAYSDQNCDKKDTDK